MASPVKMMYVRATGQMSLKHTTFLSFGTGDDSGLLKAGGVFTMEYCALVRKVGRNGQNVCSILTGADRATNIVSHDEFRSS